MIEAWRGWAVRSWERRGEETGAEGLAASVRACVREATAARRAMPKRRSSARASRLLCGCCAVGLLSGAVVEGYGAGVGVGAPGGGFVAPAARLRQQQPQQLPARFPLVLSAAGRSEKTRLNMVLTDRPREASFSDADLPKSRRERGNGGSESRASTSTKRKSGRKSGAGRMTAVPMARSRRRQNAQGDGQVEEAPFVTPQQLSMGRGGGSNKSSYNMFQALGRARLLTKEEEVTLGMKIQRLVKLQETKSELEERIERDATDAEWADVCGFEDVREFRELVHECTQAKHLMVRSNMRLVIAVAKKYGSLGVPLTDLIQEGSIGLVRAAEKYDPGRGFKFSTYAAWWVQQAVYKCIACQSRVIRLPVHVHNLLYQVRRARRTLIAENGWLPSDSEVAAHLGMPVERLKHYLRASRGTVSMEVQVGTKSAKEAKDVSLFDTLESNDSSAVPEETAEMRMFRHSLEKLVDCLPEEERLVLTLRYGLQGQEQVKSLGEIADIAQTTRAAVKKAETSALQKLRSPDYHANLGQFYDVMSRPLEDDSPVEV